MSPEYDEQLTCVLKENPEPNECIGIFGLSYETTEEDLRRIFSKYGKIEALDVVKDKKTDCSRGFAFCRYNDMEEATLLIQVVLQAIEKAKGMRIHGREIRVDYSTTREAHPPTPGVYLGKRS
ncbi:TRA2A, partial [Cordylochernes scorpioides]